MKALIEALMRRITRKENNKDMKSLSDNQKPKHEILTPEEYKSMRSKRTFEEPNLGNMKCGCMRYAAGDFTARCRNCGLFPKEKA